MDEQPKPEEKPQNFIADVASKIVSAENILIALSRNPSVDEIATAIGLALYFEEMGKHTTAIYSGETPNVLQFLKPEETFETTTDSLQDFIIALNKEKADHLRYKIDGDYVKVFVTPYKTTIDEEDLEFSHGDYNVDLVVALNVPTASDLDAALSEHGRIMHDASTVDITTSEPGRFGEIEWSDTSMSSVGEMVANLLFALKKPAVSKSVATALLTGIVSATNRFSNENTKSSTMAMASKLMDLGADQQLIAMNIMENAPLELIGAVDIAAPTTKKKDDDDVLTVNHTEEDPVEAETTEVAPAEGAAEASAEVPAENVAKSEQPQENIQPPELDYSKMMEEALAESLDNEAPAESPVSVENLAPVESVASVENPAAAMAPEVPVAPEANDIPEMSYMEAPQETSLESAPANLGEESYVLNEPEKVVEPLSDMPVDDAVLPPPPMPPVDLAMPAQPIQIPELPPIQPITDQTAAALEQPLPVPEQPLSAPEQPLPAPEPPAIDAFQIPNMQ